MVEPQPIKSDLVSESQKRVALESVLHSNAFARADQIKSFLKFVCEMEIAGRGRELTEYVIGVEALGRPSNYSPGDDSAVRNRAFALRKKLQECYETELADAPIRIELTKGSYCPHFVENTPGSKHHSSSFSVAELIEPSAANGETHLPATSSQEIIATPSAIAPAVMVAKPDRKQMWLGFVAGIVLSGIAALLVWWQVGKTQAPTTGQSVPEIVAEAWGPILTSQSEVVVSVANPPSMAIHRTEDWSAADPNGYRANKESSDWLKQKFSVNTNQDLFLTAITNGTYWGDSLGAMTVMKTLVGARVPNQMYPERVISVPTLRRKNVILFGAPEYSPAVAHYLEKCPLTVNYLRGIVEQGQPALKYSIKRDTKFKATEVYGLITVLPSKSSATNEHRTLIFSGVNSAGAQAAAEFFSSPTHLAELQKRLKQEGHDQFPNAYQVVVKAEPDDNILLNFRYETHRIIPAMTLN